MKTLSLQAAVAAVKHAVREDAAPEELLKTLSFIGMLPKSDKAQARR